MNNFLADSSIPLALRISASDAALTLADHYIAYNKLCFALLKAKHEKAMPCVSYLHEQIERERVSLEGAQETLREACYTAANV